MLLMTIYYYYLPVSTVTFPCGVVSLTLFFPLSALEEEFLLECSKNSHFLCSSILTRISSLIIHGISCYIIDLVFLWLTLPIFLA